MPDRHLWTRHSTKTIALDGTAGNGAETSDVTVFTITGRVFIHQIVAFCTESLLSAGGGTLALGVVADTDAFLGSITATNLDTNDWWTAATGTPAGAVTYGFQTTSDASTSALSKAVATDIIITIGTADITDGTIVFDVIYTPLTDGARLF